VRRVALLYAFLVAAAMAIAACSAGDDDAVSTTSPPATSAVATGTVAVTELVAGDCVSGVVIGEAERIRVESVDIVRCDRTHELEVFATFELSADDFDTEEAGYPGEERVVSAADQGCTTRLEELGEIADTVGLIAVWPTLDSWRAGDRSVACAVYSTTGTPFQGPGIVADD
jgi:hypothetical protein